MKKLLILIFALTSAYAGHNYSLNQVMVDLHDYKKPVFFCFDKDTYSNNISNSELKQFQAYIREYVKYNFSFHLENHNKPWQNIAYTQHGIEYVMVCELRIRFSVHAVLTLYYQGDNDMQWEQIYSVNYEIKKPIWGEIAESLAEKISKITKPACNCSFGDVKPVENKPGKDNSGGDKSNIVGVMKIKKYDSDWFPVEFAKVYEKKHSLGCIPTFVQVWFSESSDGSNRTTITGVSNYAGAATSVGHIDAHSISVKTGAGCGHIVYFHDRDGTYRYPRKGYLKIVAIYIGN